jgi:ribonucleoside-diphosphate reductase alpha chain
MDCDTTGIEPDIALVKYKQLVGGGMLKMVNRTVAGALATRGYAPEEIESIVNYIDENDTIEGAPALRDEDLSIFDCAFPAASGSRSISYTGHIRMMAAVQPFLSGGISKTVNMPRTSTPEDIIDAYTTGWELGLKCLAIYRDGSKRSQPLSTKQDESAAKSESVSAEAVASAALSPRRRKLPDQRNAITHKFSITGHDGYLTVGLYDDGQPGELFLKMAKEGSTISGLMDTVAIMTSIALQYGVPLKTLVDKFSHTRFEPSGFTPNPEIPIAKSVTDYVFRWLGLTFLTGESQTEDRQETEAEAVGLAVVTPHGGSRADAPATWVRQLDAPPCSNCGSIMYRAGACYLCGTCGETGGCG